MATNIKDLTNKVNGEELPADSWNRLVTAVIENQDTKMSKDELNDSILLALAKARETGDFKGDKGDKGEQGIQGVAGKDGVNGQNGLNGLDGRDGKDGKDGQNSFSSYYDENTKTLSITGTLVNLNNEEF